MPTTTITATPAQMRFLNDLRVQRGMEAYAGPELDKREASRLIDTTKALPIVRAQRAVVANQPAFPNVPEGKYAFTADAGHTAFAQVSRPTRGRWVGRVFVDLLVGAPGDWRKIAQRGAAATTILAKIDTFGAQESMARYGHEHGRCGACESPLSDPESIALGIGPVCRRRRGW